MGTATLSSQGFSVGPRPNTPLFLNSMDFGAGSFRDRVNSTGNRLRTSSKAIDRVRSEMGGRISPASEAEHKLSGSNTSLEDGENDDAIQMEIKRFGSSSTMTEIIEAMKQPTDGLSFLVKQPGLPQLTFISGEAVAWIRDRVEGINSDAKAIEILEKCLAEELISHASGVPHPVINGFYLYYINDQSKDSNAEDPDLLMFQNEWIEVEIPPVKSDDSFEGSENWEVDLELKQSQIQAHDMRKKLSFRKSKIDIHFATKNINEQTKDRVEWGQAKYHSHFYPGTAYEIVLEWMVATGNMIAELVSSWARKAGSMSLHLVPIPSDPFALPFSSKSDPLRGPIFIPLNFECLPFNHTLIDENLSAFQDKILQIFGFLSHWDMSTSSNQQQYVHISGSIFVIMLPNKPALEDGAMEIKQNKKLSIDEICSPHEEYITRHFSDVRKSEEFHISANAETRVGFLLSWNYMITKRWKTAATGDEQFMRRVLHDMLSFCANDSNRLIEFWNLQLMEGIDPITESVLPQ